MNGVAASHPRQELFRFVVNGLVATAVHYAVLTFNLEVLGFGSAGVANLSDSRGRDAERSRSRETR